MSDLRLSTSTSIDAPIGEVWQAITSPTLIKRWFFGVDTKTDWKVGSALVHTGEWKGKPYEDKGTILKFEPPVLLVHTHWSDVAGVPDDPENYQEVTWALSERNGSTDLRITERNLPSEGARAASEDGWRAALSGLKELLET